MPGPQNFVRAFLLADQVIREAVSNKLSIVGCFTEVNSPKFPVIVPVMHLYVRIENVPAGTHQVEVRGAYTDFQKEEIMSANGPTPAQDSVSDADLVFGMSPVMFPRPGQAIVEVKMDGQIVCSRGLTVKKIDQPKAPVGGK